MIDIYIPFYRDKQKLDSAVSSARSQHNADCNITILDDGAEDLSAEFDSPPTTLPAVRYIRNESNLGMVRNWNQGLDSASGLATILHADDVMLPSYVDVMSHAAREHSDAAIYFCKAEVIDEEGQRSFSFPDFVKKFIARHEGVMQLRGEKGIAKLLQGNFIFCPTMLFNVERLSGLRFDNRWKFVQDLDFILRVLEAGGEVIGVPEVCYQYRRHSSNATVDYTRTLLRFREENTLYLEAAARYEARGWHQAAKVARRRSIIQLNLTYCALRDLVALRIADFASKVKLYVSMFFRRSTAASPH